MHVLGEFWAAGFVAGAAFALEAARRWFVASTAEYLELKKRDLRLDDLFRVPAQSKAEVMQVVAQTKRRCGWPAHRTLAALGVPRSVYYGWRRRECLQDRPGVPCRVYEVLPEERGAICEVALAHPKVGYRKLTWMMVDAGIACVGVNRLYVRPGSRT